ncbi:unnamed protein product, partial [Durusdinium trenchii]
FRRLIPRDGLLSLDRRAWAAGFQCLPIDRAMRYPPRFSRGLPDGGEFVVANLNEGE